MTELPQAVAGSGARRWRDLDVRPVLEKGGDPFSLILKTTQGLADDEALHLVVQFEPKPLYAVMKSLGRVAWTREEAGVFHVWFYRDGAAAPAPGAAAPSGKEPLQPPVSLDVSGLEPPQPMMVILERLGELGPGAQLLVRHHKEPVLLYEKLALRGYGARAEKRGEGDFLIHIAPAWVFAERPVGR